MCRTVKKFDYSIKKYSLCFSYKKVEHRKNRKRFMERLSITQANSIQLKMQICPKCHEFLWTRPHVPFICGRCYIANGRIMLLNPAGEGSPFDTDLITWTDEELAKLNLMPVSIPPLKDPTSRKRSSQTAAIEKTKSHRYLFRRKQGS